jgi:hypothetical protein
VKHEDNDTNDENSQINPFVEFTMYEEIEGEIDNGREMK